MTPRSSQILFALILLAAASFCKAQTTVTLAPIPQFVSYLQNGTPNAFGCVFTYSSGTTSPIATYTDSSGLTQNANPVVLTAGGTANIWLAAGQSYTLTVKSYGGINCASGSSQYTVNGIGGGASTLTTVVPSSATPNFIDFAQNQLFEFTLTGNTVALPLSVVGVTPPGLITFQLTEDSVGGHSFAWPSGITGGCSIGTLANQVTVQQFLWNGTTATALGGCTIGATASGPILGVGELLGAELIVGTVIDALLGYQINGNYGPAGRAIISTGAGSAFSSAPIPQMICANGVTVTVSASVTTAQPLTPCQFAAGALNATNKTFRVTGDATFVPGGGSQNTFLSFGAGGTTALGNFNSLAEEIGSGTSWAGQTELTCIVTSSGASGTLTCLLVAPLLSPGAPTVVPSQVFTISPLDFTSALYVGEACQFSIASTSNTCTQHIFTVEQLN